MRKVIIVLFSVMTLFCSDITFALLQLELTQGVAGAIPISIMSFSSTNNSPQNVSSIISSDLQNSGRFKVYGQNALGGFSIDARAIFTHSRQLGSNNVVMGTLKELGNDRYQVNVQLYDIFADAAARKTVFNKTYTVNAAQLREVAHHISDLIYQELIGVRGIFSTKLAYVVVQSTSGGTRHILEVSDQDGYNPRPLLNSPEPIMSPAWSPNAKQIAYVSFENRTASIYIEDVATGGRRLITQFPGINGAPAWSPDGKKLAVVLSKSGSPNIYILTIATHALTAITHDFYINTEPAWSASGETLLFTSNRSGDPQIYQVNLASGVISRLTYDGNYNARATFTRDGQSIAMIHRTAGIYNIALLDLNTGTLRVLTDKAKDSASPSIAPNGSMILYDTVHQGQNVLGMVSSDGRIQLLLPARNGEAQDPAWSPFLA